MLATYANITDLTAEEQIDIQKAVASNNRWSVVYALCAVINQRALIGFTTHAHTGASCFTTLLDYRYNALIDITHTLYTLMECTN